VALSFKVLSPFPVMMWLLLRCGSIPTVRYLVTLLNLARTLLGRLGREIIYMILSFPALILQPLFYWGILENITKLELVNERDTAASLSLIIAQIVAWYLV
jgi:hypothetical protein